MHQLNQMEKLANGGRLGRLLHNPLRYLSSQVFLKFIYPKTFKGRLRNARTFFGAEMEVLLPAATDVYLTGGKTHDSEIRLARFMVKNLKKGDVFMDIGAHFGYYTLMAAELVGPHGRVFAFEAAASSFGILKKNVRNSPQVQVFHYAVSNCNQAISFYEFPVLYSEYNSLDVTQFKAEGWFQKYQPSKTEVRAIRIDDFVANHPQCPTYIKIDVEGAEDKVLQGSKGMLATNRPVIIMEYISNSPNAAVYYSAFELLRGYGYTPHIVRNDGGLVQLPESDSYFKTNIISENIVFLPPGK